MTAKKKKTYKRATKKVPVYKRRVRKGQQTGIVIRFPHLFSKLYIKRMGKLKFRRTVMYFIRHAHGIDIDGLNAAYAFVHKILSNPDAWALDYIDFNKLGMDGLEEYKKLKENCSKEQYRSYEKNYEFEDDYEDDEDLEIEEMLK